MSVPIHYRSFCSLYRVHTSATAPVARLRGSKRPSQGFWAELFDLWRPEWWGKVEALIDPTRPNRSRRKKSQKKGREMVDLLALSFLVRILV